MLTLTWGHRLEDLARVLADRLADTPDPLRPQTLVVPQLGMEQWLRNHLAERCGVVFNLRFVLARQFVWEQLRLLYPHAPAQSPHLPDIMRWVLEEHLPADPRVPLDPQAPALERYNLAQRMAGIFANYLSHRPAWMRGQFPEHPHAAWQQDAWETVCEALGQVPTRADLLAQQPPPEILQGGQQSGQAGALGAPHLFAPAFLGSDVRQLLGMAGEHPHWHMHLYVHASSRHYIGDLHRGRARRAGASGAGGAEGAGADEGLAQVPVSVGGRLFAAFGQRERQMQAQLQAHAFAEELDLGGQAPGSLDRDEQLAPGALGRLQRALLELGEETSLGRADDSLCFRACHNKLREVEVLRDFVLQSLQRHPDLTPADFLVMAPDIREYASAIHAVFGCGDERVRLPYSLADSPRELESELVQTALQLVEECAPLPGSDALPPLEVAVLGRLLEVPAFLARFHLEEEDARGLLRDLAEQGGYRGGAFAAAAEAGEEGEVADDWRIAAGDGAGDGVGGQSLRAGWQRLLLASARGGDPGLDNHLADATGLSRFLAMLRQLDGTRQALWRMDSEAAAQLAWQGLCGLFRARSEGDFRELQALRSAGERVLEQRRRAGAGGAISPAVLGAAVRAALGAQGLERGYLNGAITFCSLEPMRTVPAQVICALGMDAGAFPRSPPMQELDLMAAHPAPGDPGRREDDFHLFLHLLMNARRRLYFSYRGLDIRDNSVLLPAAPLAMLLQMLQGDPVRRARLHPMDVGDLGDSPNPDAAPDVASDSSRDGGGGDAEDAGGAGERQSWALEWLPLPGQRPSPPPAPALQAPDPKRRPAEPAVLELRGLEAFVRAPWRQWMRRQLRAHPRFAEAALPSAEPLAPSALDRWRMLDQTLHSPDFPAALPPPPARPASVPEDLGRLGWAGQAAWLRSLLEADSYAEHLQGWEPLAQPHPIDWRDGDGQQGDGQDGAQEPGLRLLDELPLQGDGAQVRLVLLSASRTPAGRDMNAADLDLWVRHLALCACPPAQPLAPSLLLARSNSSASVQCKVQRQLAPLPPQRAAQLLRQLLAAWVQGQEAPLPFDAGPSLAYAAHLDAVSEAMVWKDGAPPLAPDEARKQLRELVERRHAWCFASMLRGGAELPAGQGLPAGKEGLHDGGGEGLHGGGGELQALQLFHDWAVHLVRPMWMFGGDEEGEGEDEQ